jgi:Protein of unknown function (DUF2442)
MIHVVTEVRALPPDRLWVRFTDGVHGEVDLSELIGRGVFRSLLDPAVFARVGIDEFGAVCWPDGLDLAPDAMHAALRAGGSWRPRLAAAAATA